MRVNRTSAPRSTLRSVVRFDAGAASSNASFTAPYHLPMRRRIAAGRAGIVSSGAGPNVERVVGVARQVLVDAPQQVAVVVIVFVLAITPALAPDALASFAGSRPTPLRRVAS
jgi:hypothetical protein